MCAFVWHSSAVREVKQTMCVRLFILKPVEFFGRIFAVNNTENCAGICTTVFLVKL